MEYSTKNNTLIVEPIYPNNPEDGYFLKAVAEHYGYVVSIEVPSLLFLPDAGCLRDLRRLTELEINSVVIPMTVGALSFERQTRGDIEVKFDITVFNSRIKTTGVVKVSGENSTGFLREFRSILDGHHFTND